MITIVIHTKFFEGRYKCELPVPIVSFSIFVLIRISYFSIVRVMDLWALRTRVAGPSIFQQNFWSEITIEFSIVISSYLNLDWKIKLNWSSNRLKSIEINLMISKLIYISCCRKNVIFSNMASFFYIFEISLGCTLGQRSVDPRFQGFHCPCPKFKKKPFHFIMKLLAKRCNPFSINI